MFFGAYLWTSCAGDLLPVEGGNQARLCAKSGNKSRCLREHVQQWQSQLEQKKIASHVFHNLTFFLRMFFSNLLKLYWSFTVARQIEKMFAERFGGADPIHKILDWHWSWAATSSLSAGKLLEDFDWRRKPIILEVFQQFELSLKWVDLLCLTANWRIKHLLNFLKGQDERFVVLVYWPLYVFKRKDNITILLYVCFWGK